MTDSAASNTTDADSCDPGSPKAERRTSPEAMDEVSVQFLLVEYELIAGLRDHVVNAFHSSTTRVVGLNTAALGGLLLLATVDGTSFRDSALALGVVGILLSIVNHNLARRAVAYQVSTRRYLRALNRLRGFFVQRDQAIEGAISLPTEPNFPPMSHLGPGKGLWGGTQGEAVGLAAMSLSFTSAGWTALILELIGLPDPVALGSSIASGFVAASTAVMYWNRRAERAFLRAEDGDNYFYVDDPNATEKPVV